MEADRCPFRLHRRLRKAACVVVMAVAEDDGLGFGHPDAETVYQRVRRRVTGISRDTVYRTLASLETQGLVRKAEILFDRGRYDANTDRHHHFVCTACGLVSDFYSEPLNDLPIPKLVRAMGSIQSTHVQVRGICRDCSSKRSRRKNPKDKEPTHGE